MPGLRANVMTDAYACAWCGTRYVVPLLARLCESKHLEPEQEKR